jgi:hypothetical protein
VNIATELMLNKNAPPAFTPGISPRQLQHYTENAQGKPLLYSMKEKNENIRSLQNSKKR